MKYELRKMFCDIKIIIIIVICLMLNAISILNICMSELPDYTYSYEYNQNDIDEIYNNAIENKDNGQDVTLMNVIARDFKDRQWNYYAYNSREYDFVEHTISIFMMIILSVILTARLLGIERTGSMNKVLCVTGGRITKLFLNKQLAIIINSAALSFIFACEELILYSVLGGINPFLSLYTVPGYISTWFNGNILEYKFMTTTVVFIILFIVSELTYIIGFFIKGELPAIAISTALVIGLQTATNALPELFRFITPFSIINNRWMISSFAVTYIGNTFFYTYILSIFAGILISIILYMISDTYARRRGII